ncbi:M15 family metallopeptidase [Candidatus Peregrinibacteria bacterium]|nr:MAG: M15 family metallopeptidase [Candidatus Peregrinibacteria bacterium]
MSTGSEIHRQLETPEETPEREARQKLEEKVGGVDDGSSHFSDSETPKSEGEKQQEKAIQQQVAPTIREEVLSSSQKEQFQNKSTVESEEKEEKDLIEYLLKYFAEYIQEALQGKTFKTEEEKQAFIQQETKTHLSEAKQRASQTLDTIDDPDTKKRVSEFVSEYSSGGNISKDFRSSEYINFQGSTFAMVNNEVLPDFAKLAVSYWKMTGQKLIITSAYRSIKHQEKIYATARKGYAAKPGNSNHNTGHAIDLHPNSFRSEKIGGLPSFIALAKQCNFTKLGHEDWHFDHVTKRSAGAERMALAQKCNQEVS